MPAISTMPRLDAFSEIAFGFEAPVAGLVEVLIDAQSTIGTHDLRTEDEWGWSNSSTVQTNFLKLDVLHPNVPEPSYAEMSSFSFKTDDDHTVHREYLVRGQHYLRICSVQARCRRASMS